MADESPVFLTDERRDVLNGEYQGADSTERVHRANIRKRAKKAIQELIEVAQSPEIENTSEVFEPDEIARLIDSLMVPQDATLTPRWNFDGDPEEYRDTYRYQLALHARLSHTLDGYDDMLHRNHPPGEEVPLLDTDNEL